MCLLLGDDVIDWSFFILGLFLILIENMCIFLLCSKVVLFFVFWELLDILFVNKIIILVEFVFLVLKIDILVYLSVLLVFVFLFKYWMCLMFVIMVFRLLKLWNLNIFFGELLYVMILNLKNIEFKFWIIFCINVFIVLKWFDLIFLFLFMIIRMFVFL